MSTLAPDPPALHVETPARNTALAPGALGLTSVIFCIVTGAAPAAAMLFNVPVAVLGVGYATPAAFLVATVVLTVFSVGYIEMAQRVSATGGFYTFVTRGFGRVAGMGTAVTIALCYMIFAAAVMGTMGYFFAVNFESWFGVDIPAYVYSFAGLALITSFGWFHIELTAKVLGVALVSEIVALTVLAVAVLVSGGDSGLPAAPLNPVEIFDNPGAISAFGAAAVGVGLFAAFWSWVGFEMAPNYAEESKEPKKYAKVATYGSVIGLGVFYIVISYVFVVGWGQDDASQAVADQFEGKFGSAFYPLTDRYVGGGLTTALQALIITSSFACALAFYNTSARYLFSLSRERALPAVLGRTHAKHHSPYAASVAVTVFCGVWILGFTLYDSSTEAFFLKLGTWSPLMGVLGILAIQALVSFAIIRYFWTEARDGFHPWRTLIAPIIGGIAQLGACYLLIANRSALAGAGDVPFIKYLPWVVAAMFLAGLALGLWMKARAPDRYALIGSFEHDERAVHERNPAGGPLEPAGY